MTREIVLQKKSTCVHMVTKEVPIQGIQLEPTFCSFRQLWNDAGENIVTIHVLNWTNCKSDALDGNHV